MFADWVVTNFREYQVKGDYQELMVQRVRLAHLVREVLLVKRESKVQL